MKFEVRKFFLPKLVNFTRKKEGKIFCKKNFPLSSKKFKMDFLSKSFKELKKNFERKVCHKIMEKKILLLFERRLLINSVLHSFENN